MRHLLIPFFLFPLFSFAQDSRALSLADVEKLWQQHSRELHLAEANLNSAAADLRIAGQRPNPVLSLNVLSINSWSSDRNGSWNEKKADAQLRIDQLLERGNKRELRIKSSESRLAAARFDLEETARQQLGILRNAYFDLRLAQEKLALARDAANLYGKSVDLGRIRQKSGDIAPVDLSRLQIDKAKADGDARQMQMGLEQAQYALAYLIGRENEAKQLIATDNWPPLEKHELSPLPLAQRPDIEAAKTRIIAAEANRDLARAQTRRDVTIGLQFERNGQNMPANSVGLGVSVPIFAWHEHEGDIARSEVDFDVARLQYEQQQAQAAASIAQAKSALLSASDRYKGMEGGQLADAERVARGAELAYEKGAMSLLELLDARRTLRQTQIEAATAHADYAKALSDWQIQAEFRTLK